MINCQQQQGLLVSIGFNFGEYDDHIIKAINEAASQSIEDRLRSMYIGVFLKVMKIISNQ